MQLVMMLVVVVSILTILSGVSVIAGSSKKERSTAIWFLLVAVGAAIWSISVGVFLSLTGNEEATGLNLVQMIFISSTLTLVALVGNTSWRYKLGKITTIIFAVIGLVLSVIVLCVPETVFSAVEIKNTGNVVHFNIGACSIAYGALISLCTLVAFVALIYRITHTRKRNVKSGNIVYLIGIAITIACSLPCDLIMPMNSYCALMWVGPITVATTMLGYYYAILRYRLMVLSSAWMKILSYVILMASGAVIYMVIFYIIFMALFKGSKPSMEVILLNFIMVLIVLLLMPVINEVSAFIKSLISTKQVDIAYIIKKLNQVASQNVDLADLAGFLAEHTHFSYVGFIVDGRLYAPRDVSLSSNEIIQISGLKSTNSGVWQDFNEPVSRVASEHDITAIAELRNAKGQAFGQIIVGRPFSKSHFESKDLVQLEMVINLVAVIIDSKKKK